MAFFDFLALAVEFEEDESDLVRDAGLADIRHQGEVFTQLIDDRTRQ